MLASQGSELIGGDVSEYTYGSCNELRDSTEFKCITSHTSKISLLHINIRSIHNKIEDLKYFLEQLNKPQIVVVSETWLKESEVAYFNLPGYTAYFACRVAGRGGGVAIYVQNCFSQNLLSSKNDNYYSLWVEVLNISTYKKLYIGGYYKPPQCKVQDFLAFLDNDLTNCKEVTTFVMGDFNINVNDQSRDSTMYNVVYMSNGFHVLNTQPTRMNNNIDHILTNAIKETSSIFTIENSLSDHCGVLAMLRHPYKINSNKVNQIGVPVINYPKVVQLLEHKLRSSNSAINIVGVDPNTSLESIIDKINESIKEATEYKKHKKFNRALCPWANKQYIELVGLRDKLFKKYKKKRNNTNIKLELSVLNNRVTMLKRSLIKEYQRNIFMECQGDSKKMWRNINMLTNRASNTKTDVEVVIDRNSKIITDKQGITNAFCEHFTSISTNTSNNLASFYDDNVSQLSLGTLDNVVNSIFLNPTDEIEVGNIINSLKNGKSPGHDGISATIIKQCKDILIPLITQNINLVLSSGKFPKVLKIAQVIPLHKAGAKKDLNNYRPISVLSVFSKIYEKVIHKRFLHFYESTNFLYSHQYGFRKNYNTGSAVMSLVHEIQTAVDENKLAGSIFVDLHKAFDMVNHRILLKKLEMSGVRGIALQLMVSYLENRVQFVKIGQYKSDTRNVICGVPQGSVLGPLLFLVYINDIGKLKLHGVPKLFADDTALFYIAAKTEQELAYSMQEDLSTLNEYLRLNRLALNANKTNYVLFTSSNLSQKIKLPAPLQINNTIIKRVNCVKYLGLYIDENLKWDTHVECVTKKVLPVVGVLWRLSGAPVEVKSIIYNSLINSHLQYLNMVWGSASKKVLYPLQIAQNKAIKAVHNLSCYTNTRTMYDYYKILPIKLSYEFNLLVYIYKNCCSNDKIRHSYRTRQGNNKFLHTIRTEIGRKAYTFQGYQYFNALPAEIKRISSCSQFKIKLKEHLLEHLSSSL